MTWIRLGLPGAEILFSDRTGGVSAPPFDTANAGYARGDDPGNVDENRGRIGAALGGPNSEPARWTCLRQVHGADVFCPGRDDSGLPTADAAVSTDPGAVLSVLTADCAPVALVAPGVVGAVHAGWRGILAGVLEAAVAEMQARTAGPIRAILGPCIHPECYEFSAGDLGPIAARLGPEVAGTTVGGQPALDLPVAVALALSGAGVDEIDDVNICTACSADHFSHRRDSALHGTTGLQTMLVAAR